ncbi:MAG: UDP-2,4-diacetamido-2,4,6-trideoxy-beta-L-altropyranose hydrolase [Sterolibacterium sp.]|nr:UDP-2,4-diacetamido-2,4,6-trideoxy-beta-L-altropyranose hydrolase [Sterolibacterium sp.]
MRVAFRVDASSAIGSGHLMRCLALADLLREHGTETLFVTRAAEQPWRALLRQHGHGVSALSSDSDDPAQDAKETRAALMDGNWPDWLVVDHYGLDSQWEAALRTSCGRIFAIDDIGRPHDCDLLLDQNVLDNPESYRDQVPANCRRLLGPGYALLRREFREERARLRHRNGRVHRVLISFGGSDPTGETEIAIEGFLASDLANGKASVDVVLGSANPRQKELRLRYEGHSHLHVLGQSDNMAELMASADLAIGACGSTAWERCCLGLPSIVINIADNQASIAKALILAGAAQSIDTSKRKSSEITDALELLADNPVRMNAMSKAALGLTDGQGVIRIIEHLSLGKLCP